MRPSPYVVKCYRTSWLATFPTVKWSNAISSIEPIDARWTCQTMFTLREEEKEAIAKAAQCRLMADTAHSDSPLIANQFATIAVEWEKLALSPIQPDCNILASEIDPSVKCCWRIPRLAA